MSLGCKATILTFALPYKVGFKDKRFVRTDSAVGIMGVYDRVVALASCFAA